MTTINPPRRIVWKCRLRQLRRRDGLSLTDVEQATGINRQVVHNAECGRELRLGTAFKLAKLFRVSVEDMWERI